MVLEDFMEQTFHYTIPLYCIFFNSLFSQYIVYNKNYSYYILNNIIF